MYKTIFLLERGGTVAACQQGKVAVHLQQDFYSLNIIFSEPTQVVFVPKPTRPQAQHCHNIIIIRVFI